MSDKYGILTPSSCELGARHAIAIAIICLLCTPFALEVIKSSIDDGYTLQKKGRQKILPYLKSLIAK